MKTTGYAVSVDDETFFINGIERKRFFSWDFRTREWSTSSLINDYDPEFLKDKYHNKIGKVVRRRLKLWYPPEKEIKVYAILDRKWKVEI